MNILYSLKFTLESKMNIHFIVIYKDSVESLVAIKKRNEYSFLFYYYTDCTSGNSRLVKYLLSAAFILAVQFIDMINAGFTYPLSTKAL